MKNTIIEPGLDKLMEKVDCRYTLVVETAKRARQIIDGNEPLTTEVHQNPVSQAVEEIGQGKITYIRNDADEEE